MQQILDSIEVSLIVLSVLITQHVEAKTALAEGPVVAQVEQKIEIPPLLKEIGRCESGNRQFEKDGSVRRGRVNPKDVGKYQINEYWHLETSKKMGINIYTEEGNTEYALHLLKTQGSKPWNASKHCWSSTKVE